MTSLVFGSVLPNTYAGFFTIILNHVPTFFFYSDLHVCISYPKSRNLYSVIDNCQTVKFFWLQYT